MVMLNEAKYRNAILYFVQNTKTSLLGKVKLMKLLYYLDFGHFELFQTSVTGDAYQRLPMGPVPMSVAGVVHRMEQDNQLMVRYRDIGLQYPQTEYTPLQSVDMSVFTETERDMLISVAQKWYWHTKREIVDASHGEIPWIQTEPNAIIDYALVLTRANEFETDLMMDDMGGDILTPEEQTLRADGKALMRRFEEMAKTNQAYQEWMQEGLTQLNTGRYTVSFLEI